MQPPPNSAQLQLQFLLHKEISYADDDSRIVVWFSSDKQSCKEKFVFPLL